MQRGRKGNDNGQNDFCLKFGIILAFESIPVKDCILISTMLAVFEKKEVLKEHVMLWESCYAKSQERK